ncbi:Neutral ceramidase [Liparis tanakae]|uniref:Neutral ceramidase n=1 Tax=Liparis tanakae TaxID=230148 RepID=A0A4Z2E607_9TELE|nr:Neutral ceramidase [Liparis tanakae]
MTDLIVLICWFAVHAVSMNSSNRLVSSDNLGHASYLLEQDMNRGQLPGQHPDPNRPTLTPTTLTPTTLTPTTPPSPQAP